MKYENCKKKISFIRTNYIRKLDQIQIESDKVELSSSEQEAHHEISRIQYIIIILYAHGLV